MKTKLVLTLAVAFCLTLIASARCRSSDKHKTHYNLSNTPITDIVDIATGNDDFSILVVALKTAGLVETLHADGPFKVFAAVNATSLVQNCLAK